MLAPDTRALLLDALRPPPGHSLDHAVATTFTLDLETALMVPLAFAGFRFDDQPDPIEVMEGLRGMGERLDVFCQAGAIGVARWPSDLLALVEDVIHPVRRPRPGHIFHPKVWVLRFVDRSDEPAYRLLVLSRNLTPDRSWDTILWLDGRPEGEPRPGNAPLARFVAALPRLAVTPLPPARRAAVAALADELGPVVWDLPAGVREARFHSIGLPGSPPFAADGHFEGDRVLAVSPFIRGGAIRRLFQSHPEQAVLVSRGEELDALHAHDRDVLEGLDVYELDPTASLASDDAEGDSPQTFLTRLHAKLFVAERGRQARLFVGSANATDAGLEQNVEFLCELVGPAASLGVEALVGDDAPFRKMLTPYVPSPPEERDEEAITAGRALEDLIFDIAAGARFDTKVTRHVDGWVPSVSTDTALPRFPDGTSVTLAAHNRPAETYSLAPGEPVQVELSPRELGDITPFLQVTARLQVGREVIERSTVICSRLHGAPEERFREILARQVDTPEKFMRLLALLIGFAARTGTETGAAGDGTWSWSPGGGEGVLELLARALSERPESIDHLEAIVERLRESPTGRTVLPHGWDDVWLPALKARRSMVGDAS
ncbi:MAG: hypothetical protein F4X80_07915 [Chloroflexi bacterium]|nr:hypothetical protein [Chloroflexota bacterium]MYE32559.1 hypothetical protein [Chloroflexota bacterium]